MTHPFHPLCGGEYEIVSSRHCWGEERIYFHDEVRQLRLLPASWTDAGPTDPFVVIAAGRSHFRVVDLLRLVELVEQAPGSQAGCGESGSKGNYAVK